MSIKRVSFESHTDIIWQYYAARCTWQVFLTPVAAFAITDIYAWLYRSNTVNNVTLEVRAAAGTQQPVGGTVVSVTIPGASIGTGSGGYRTRFQFATNPVLIGASLYGFRLICDGADVSNCIRSKGVAAGDPYPDGQCGYSTTGGWFISWLAGEDMYFEVWGDTLPGAPACIADKLIAAAVV